MKRRLAVVILLALAGLGVWLCVGRGQIETTSPAIAAELQPDVHFYFVQVTDTHFGSGKKYRHIERNQAVREAVNKLPLPISCVVVTGDVFSDKIYKDEIRARAKSHFDGFDKPVHFLPGNHDLRPGKYLETNTKTWQDTFGPLSHTADYHGVRFVFVYTEPLAKGFAQPGYDALAWLEATLDEAGEMPVLVFHHTPSVDDFYNNEMHPGWAEDIRRKWAALLNRHNVKGVVAGHFHRDEMHWIGDVPLYVSTPVAGFWGRQACYRIYEYRNGKVGYRTQYIELSDEPTRDKSAEK